jgi:hypothetical protein
MLMFLISHKMMCVSVISVTRKLCFLCMFGPIFLFEESVLSCKGIHRKRNVSKMVLVTEHVIKIPAGNTKIPACKCSYSSCRVARNTWIYNRVTCDRLNSLSSQFTTLQSPVCLTVSLPAKTESVSKASSWERWILVVVCETLEPELRIPDILQTGLFLHGVYNTQNSSCTAYTKHRTLPAQRIQNTGLFLHSAYNTQNSSCTVNTTHRTLPAQCIH